MKKLLEIEIYFKGNHQGVQPPTNPSQSGGFQQPTGGNNPQYVIVPYPINLGGMPANSNCPCFYVESQGNKTQPPTYQPPTHVQGPPSNQLGPVYQGGQYAYIGFIPIVFYPHCGNNINQIQQEVRPAFPGAWTVPYLCSTCSQQQNTQHPGPTQPQPGSTQQPIKPPTQVPPQRPLPPTGQKPVQPPKPSQPNYETLAGEERQASDIEINGFYDTIVN